MNDDELLQRTLAHQAAGVPGAAMLRLSAAPGGFQPPLSPAPSASPSDYEQWQVGPNDTFRAAGVTVPSLPAGLYAGGFDFRRLPGAPQRCL